MSRQVVFVAFGVACALFGIVMTAYSFIGSDPEPDLTRGGTTDFERSLGELERSLDSRLARLERRLDSRDGSGVRIFRSASGAADDVEETRNSAGVSEATGCEVGASGFAASLRVIAVAETAVHTEAFLTHPSVDAR